MNEPVEFQITSDVPMPEVREPKIKWRELKVGDSFFVARDPSGAERYLTWGRKKYGFKFMIRPEGTGSRVWRRE